MSKVTDFIFNNIKQHLMSLGLDEGNANWCARKGAEHFQKAVGSSNNQFNDACNYAGLLAGQRCLKFKYSAQKAQSKQRAKKPQEAFDFTEQGG